MRTGMWMLKSVWPAAWLAMLLAGLALAAGPAGAAETPKAGDPAPPVSGTDQDGKSWKLSDYLGKKIVLLYFYPKDDTPGCTKEACGLRDRMEELKKGNVEVVGVSRDGDESHRKFIAKHQLNFTLLADTKGQITADYGAAMKDRNMARRVSFLIGLDGKIAHVTDNMDAAVHLSEMKEAVDKLARK